MLRPFRYITHSIEFDINLWRWHSQRELQSERFHCQIVNIFESYTIQLTAPTECALSYMQALTIDDCYVIDVPRHFWQSQSLLRERTRTRKQTHTQRERSDENGKINKQRMRKR